MFTRIWNFIRRPAGYVGKDLEGNYFYEHTSTTSDPRRTRRIVKYKGKTDMAEVANRSRQLSVQWKAWLTHTRREPPSLEELQADNARRARLAQNVALIEARDREEHLLLASDNAETMRNHIRYVVEPGHGSQEQKTSEADSRQETNGAHPPYEELGNTRHSGQEHETGSPWVPKPASDEPQPWAPKAIRRGG
ncbi:hypothetical protein DFH11DRAFT_284667 [Phellopilus nigrolimitatus]|nr:hypothetical protein DFH11DRAFT_284667 [Phellopilus nigrolimitatus]